MAATVFDPSKHPALAEHERLLVRQISDFTHKYFQNPKFDASHDFNHILRVVSTAAHILDQEQKSSGGSPEKPSLDTFTVIAGAFLHDIDDRKYIDFTHGNEPLAKQELIRLGLSEDRAQRIQSLIEGVSYNTESKNVDKVKQLISRIPELAVVQDADRLDAIGAVGIARCFAFGGAKRTRTLGESVKHFHDKLLKLEGMMKTETGRKMAAERTRRLEQYVNWWEDETVLGAS